MVPPLPMTPPDPDVDLIANNGMAVPSLDTVVHVISTERAALANLERLYATDKFSRENMERAVEQIARTINGGGKLIVCGVGKSGKIGEKLVATMNSLGIHSCFLHPTEALHGDLGMIKQNDTLLFITYSGKTSELLMLLPHIPPTLPLIVITSHMQLSSCALVSEPDIRNIMVLPAPVHEREEVSFGLPAPTTSTTTALAVGDALALATARRLHIVPGRGPAEVFKSFHPGGAIGAAFATSSSVSSSSLSSASTTPLSSIITSPSSCPLNGIPDLADVMTPPLRAMHPKLISELATPLSAIPVLSHDKNLASTSRIADALAAAVRSPAGSFWVLLTPEYVISPTRLRGLAHTHDPGTKLCDLDGDSHVVSKPNWIQVSRLSTIAATRQILSGGDTPSSEAKNEGKNATVTYNRVIMVTDDKSGDAVAFVEEKEVWQDHI
ncbi:hypothetical protein LOZ57_005286 [Ophidiomyces ophidiicola]|uniref:uncharacterized protein n=1 Tax=Ophidiomyces ophidiicola TaxID=1387563 RepID=UPI0020C449EE|nr:uncharacterized protein LOZ57_005286 [Ophidiomyces ophidiicola]KAI1942989.1 hypothetical protein LOZ57_005286 [Ophidiomyces ophidiicola]KAI2057159.1 hypothetical protein LOZ43_003231 [Ophidiomyces ophidiicola]KAI2087096.1 hypothetical protein LOZ36_002946 [Ophidiomyces ophidiicola]